MDTIAEEPMIDVYYPTEKEVLKESWPLPLDNMVKSFEDYLLDIGVRI